MEILDNIRIGIDVVKPFKNRYPEILENIDFNWTRRKAIERQIPSIFLITLPKSGSMFIKNNLSKLLNLAQFHMHTGPFINSYLVEQKFPLFVKGGIICQAHVPASEFNLILLKTFEIDKFVVHVRDPRQALLSWTHNVEQIFNRGDEGIYRLRLLYQDFPDEYFNYSFEEKISWQIENYLPLEVKWIEGWLRTSQEPYWKNKMLFTEFVDMSTKPSEVFKKILDFYDINCEAEFDFHKPKKGELHYRKGQIDEWKTIFTDEQIEKASKMMSKNMKKQFAWPD